MAVGTLAGMHCSVGTTYVDITFTRPTNCTKIIFIMTATDLVSAPIQKSYTIPLPYAIGASITYRFTGLSASKKYYLTGRPYNGSEAGTLRNYSNSTANPVNSIVMPSAKTTTYYDPLSSFTSNTNSSTSSNTSTSSNAGSGPVKPSSPSGLTIDGGVIKNSSAAGSNTPTGATDAPIPSDLNSSNRTSLKIRNLNPNQTYSIKIRAKTIDSDGQSVYSEYSEPIYITTPGFSSAGTNHITTNNNGDILLDGGSIFAGDFGSDAGLLDVVNGTTTGTGVILNKTGLAGFNSGAKEFYIDAITGKAYFAGTVTAGTVTIGSNINGTDKTGLYIDSKNYWYSDGSFSATSSDIAGAITNKKSGNTLIVPNPVVFSSSSPYGTVWSGSTLNLSWTWNSADTANQYAQNFIISFTENSVTKNISVPVTSNSYAFTWSQNQALFGLASTSISAISVKVQDSFGNLSTSASPTSVASYVSSQTPPVITGSPINNGYTISYTAPTDPLTLIEISESTTSSSTGYSVVYSGTLNPAIVLASNLNLRYVRARFLDITGSSQGYSSVITITPNSPVTLNVNAPNDVNSVSTAFTSSGTGEDINVSTTVYSLTGVTATGNGTTMTYTTTGAHGLYTGDQITIAGMSLSGYNVSGVVTVPTESTTTFTISGSQQGSGTGGVAQYSSISYIVKLVYTGNAAKVGYFYFSPTATNITSQTFTITKADLFNQFGTHYSSFSGLLISVNSSGVRSSGKSITTFSRTSSLASYTPSISGFNVADGYQIVFDFSSTNATYGEIYQKRTVWGSITSPIDYFNGTYVSGSSGSNTLVITSVKDNALNTIATAGNINGALPTGYKVTGNGIAPNTYVTAVSYTSPNFTLTLNNNLTSTPSAGSSFKINGLVYSGLSPADITNNLYEDFYIICKFYDDYDNSSLISNSVTVHPVDPGAIGTISTAVQVSGTSGAVYVGDAASSGKRVVIKAIPTDPYVGIFAFDGTNAAATTSIIANPTLAASGGYTFKTTSAQIGDWSINDTKIQNTLGSSSNYVGLSATGTYSFWAGSTTSGGDSSASFLVTPTGQVTARKISIIGDGSSSDLINAANVFKVTGQGALTATSANITGVITAQSGSVTGNLLIGGSTYSGTALTQTITAVSIPSTNTARYVLSASHSLTTNSTVYISGVTGASVGSFSGIYKIAAVNVVANSFDVTITGIAGTAVIATTAPIAQVIDITTGYVLNSSGITFNTSGTKGITTIDSSTGLFQTTSAKIGGWLISTSTNPGTIYSTSGTGTILLDSTNARISASTTGYYVGMAAPTASSSVVLWAGNQGVANTANAFTVLADGTVKIGGGASINNVLASTVTSGAAAGATALQTIPSNYLTTSTSISGGQITTGTIKNGSFPGTGSTQASDGSGFSVSGMSINLDNSSITSPSFRIVGSGVTGQTAGSAYFKGDISGSTGNIAGWTISTNSISKSATYSDPIFGTTTLTTTLGASGNINLVSSGGGYLSVGDQSLLTVSNTTSQSSISPGYIGFKSTTTLFGIPPTSFSMNISPGDDFINFYWIGGTQSGGYSQVKPRWFNYASTGERTANSAAVFDTAMQNLRPLVVYTDGTQYLGSTDYFSTTQATTPSTTTGVNGDFFFSTA